MMWINDSGGTEYIRLEEIVLYEPNVTKHDLLLLHWNELEFVVKAKLKSRYPDRFPKPNYVF